MWYHGAVIVHVHIRVQGSGSKLGLSRRSDES